MCSAYRYVYIVEVSRLSGCALRYKHGRCADALTRRHVLHDVLKSARGIGNPVVV